MSRADGGKFVLASTDREEPRAGFKSEPSISPLTSVIPIFKQPSDSDVPHQRDCISTRPGMGHENETDSRVDVPFLRSTVLTLTIAGVTLLSPFHSRPNQPAHCSPTYPHWSVLSPGIVK